MIDLVFTLIAVISPTVHGSLIITSHVYPLIHYTKLISEEHFTAGRPLVIVLPIDPKGVALPLVDSSKKEVGCFIEELNKSSRWPILVYNMDYKMNRIMYTETQQHGNYIILTPGPCTLWEYHMISFLQQVSGLLFGNDTKNLWNPTANFVVPVMSNCMQFDNKHTARTILNTCGIMKLRKLLSSS
jgi:hypothetical protein